MTGLQCGLILDTTAAQKRGITAKNGARSDRGVGLTAITAGIRSLPPRQCRAEQQRDRRMASQKLVLGYLHACTSGALPLSECGPVWQLGIIVVLLASALLALVVLRMESAVSN